MDETKATPTRGVKEIVKAELSRFWKDPLLYALERWFGCLILALALCILASGVRMLAEAVLSIVR